MNNRRNFPRLSQKLKVDPEVYQSTIDQSAAAKEFLTSEKWKFVRDYLDSRKLNILENFAKQSIDDYTVSTHANNGFSSEVHHFAQKEYSHLAGEYKLIERLYLWLGNIVEQASKMKKEAEMASTEVKRGSVDDV